MKYQCEIEIGQPRAEVVKKFNNPDNLKHWHPGLESFEHISGTYGEAGSKSKLIYQMGKRKVEMIETLEKTNLPEEFIGIYEAKRVWNRQENFFIEDGPNKTKWITNCEFKGTGIMNIVILLMPGAFKKQSRKYMENFKAFVEK